MVVYFKFWLELESRDEFLYRTRCDKRDYTRHSQLFLPWTFGLNLTPVEP